MNAPQMPGMYTPVQGGIFYPMQGSGGRGGQMYYQPQMGGQGVPRRFPQQGGKGGQQFPQGGPQGYMVQGPQQGNPRQPRQNQRRQQGGPGGPQQGGKPGQQPGRGPQFQQTARNVPPAAPPAPAPAPAPQPTPIATAPGPVDFATQLAAVPDEQQKMMLGERLFPLIDKHPEVLDQAGKITGMLLDMDTPELLHLIESPEALRQKVVEAINVLAQHGMAQAISE